MKRIRLSTLMLLVVIVALGLAVINLQRRLADRDRRVNRLELVVKRQELYLRVLATPGKERDEILKHYDIFK
jgi:hypothetical protein